MSEMWYAPYNCGKCGIRLGLPTSWQSWWWDFFGPDTDYSSPDSDDTICLCRECQGHIGETAEMMAERVPALLQFTDPAYRYEVYP